MITMYFAIISKRSFRMNWPDLELIFQPGHANWTYNPEALGIQHLDAAGNELDKFVNFPAHSQGHIERAPYNPSIGHYCDVNSRDVSDSRNWEQLVSMQHIFYYSNRSPDMQIHKHLVNALAGIVGGTTVHDSALGRNNVQRCLYNDILRPAKTFLDSPYTPLGGNTMPFRTIVDIATNGSELSLAYHHRISDQYLQTDPAHAQVSNETVEWLAELGRQHFRKSNGTRVNLFFISNSAGSEEKVRTHPAIQAAFHHVYCQQFLGIRHINLQFLNEEVTANEAEMRAKMALIQTMHDWYIMKIADILICGISSFCRSAGLISSGRQIKYDAGNHQVCYIHQWVM